MFCCVLLLVCVVICTAFMQLSLRSLYMNVIVCSCTRMLGYLFRCLSPPKFSTENLYVVVVSYACYVSVWSYHNCRVKNTNHKAGPYTASHNHCLTYQILPCTHFSHTTGVFSPCTGKPNISSVLNKCFNSYILGAGGWNKEDSEVVASIPWIYFACNLGSKLNFLALLSQIFVLRHPLKIF